MAYSKAEFVQLVQHCMEYLTPKQLGKDIGAKPADLDKWYQGKDLPEDKVIQRLGKKLQEHPMWDEM